MIFNKVKLFKIGITFSLKSCFVSSSSLESLSISLCAWICWRWASTNSVWEFCICSRVSLNSCSKSMAPLYWVAMYCSCSLITWNTQDICKFQNEMIHLAGVAQWIERRLGTKGFNSQSEHTSGLWASSPMGGVRETTRHWYFSPSLSPSLPLSLKGN